MRERKEIETEISGYNHANPEAQRYGGGDLLHNQALQLEVLLDIRDLVKGERTEPDEKHMPLAGQVSIADLRGICERTPDDDTPVRVVDAEGRVLPVVAFWLGQGVVEIAVRAD